MSHALVVIATNITGWYVLYQVRVLISWFPRQTYLPGCVFSVRYALSPMKQLSPKLLSVSLACWSNKQLNINQNTTERTRMFELIRGKKKHFLSAFSKLRKRLLASPCLSVCLSVRPSVRRNNSASTARIFVKYYI